MTSLKNQLEWIFYQKSSLLQKSYSIPTQKTEKYIQTYKTIHYCKTNFDNNLKLTKELGIITNIM